MKRLIIAIACGSALFAASTAFAQHRPAEGSVNPGEKVTFDNPKCPSGKGYIIGGSRKQGISRKEGCVPGKRK